MRLPRAHALALAAIASLGLAAAALPAAAGAADWRMEQPAPPAPPEGVPPATFEVPLGQVSDISFWAPNRGLMAVAGNSAIAQGLYRFDGRTWSSLSTVCGGLNGTTRIAWAGPDEFWTVADIRKELVLDQGPGTRTLCHFKDGAVVGSYATAANAADPWLTMQSAACLSPSDCWFSGSVLGGPRAGAFHLHWDGRSVTRIDAPQGRPVQDLAAFDGATFEVAAISDDSQAPRLTFPETTPALIHRIAAGDTDVAGFKADPFVMPVPSGENADSADLTSLDTDGQVLWAGGGAALSGPSGGTSTGGPVLAYRRLGGSFQAVPLAPGALGTATRVVDIAAEPGTDRAWVALDGSPAAVAEIGTDGTVFSLRALPDAADPDPNARAGVGSAGRIACSAPGECWMATTAGWIFHLTSGAQPALDTDPAFASLITNRPSDGGTPTFVSDSAVFDDSGAGLPDRQLDPLIKDDPTPSLDDAPAAPAASRVKVKVLSRGSISVSFRLSATARVRVLAYHGKKLASKSSRKTLKKGTHAVTLRVTPKRWPTRIKLEVLAPK